jgi:tetratricopeptide (TPR) repeat protein
MKKVIFSVLIILALTLPLWAQGAICDAYIKQALTACQKGDYRQAMKLSHAALEEALALKDPERMATSSEIFGVSLLELAQYEEAEKTFTLLLDYIEKRDGIDHVNTAPILNNLGLACKGQKKYQEAERFLRKSLNIREMQKEKDQTGIADTLLSLGAILFDQGEYSKAESLFVNALEIYHQSPLGCAGGNCAHSALLCCSNLALIYEKRGEIEKAKDLLKWALELKKFLGNDHFLVKKVLEQYQQLQAKKPTSAKTKAKHPKIN